MSIDKKFLEGASYIITSGYDGLFHYATFNDDISVSVTKQHDDNTAIVHIEDKYVSKELDIMIPSFKILNMHDFSEKEVSFFLSFTKQNYRELSELSSGERKSVIYA